MGCNDLLFGLAPELEVDTRIEFRFCAVTQPLESVHHPEWLIKHISQKYVSAHIHGQLWFISVSLRKRK